MSWSLGNIKALAILLNSMSAISKESLREVDESYKRYMENETTRTDKRA